MTHVDLTEKDPARANNGVTEHYSSNHQQGMEPSGNRHQ
jgi:hypothetical protein